MKPHRILVTVLMPLLGLLAVASLHAGEPEAAAASPEVEASAPVPAIPAPFASAAIGDADLTEMRGGMRLPNGMDVELGFDIRTLVDGELALHTQLSTQDLASSGPRVRVGSPDSTPIDITEDGLPFSSPLGDVTLARRPNGTVVTLSNSSLNVQHMIGQATGVAVLNTANDRRIDTISNIDVDVKGDWVPLANGLLGVGAIASESAAARQRP